jgi:hypothetical protein
MVDKIGKIFDFVNKSCFFIKEDIKRPIWERNTWLKGIKG